jgi:2-(1,2-epoxy-1,2-dihydrophenyl)acetyl-CoA isomerase
MGRTVLLHQERAIATLTLNREGALNAINFEMADKLTEELLSLGADGQVRSIIITGQGTAFSAGGDLHWVLAHPQGPGVALRKLAGRVHMAITEIRRIGKPVIAAINGVAAGGGFSLALACDFRIMSRDATLREAYSSAGLCLDAAGSFMLPRLVGLARALEIAALDAPISAEQALAWGLANRVVEPSQVQDASLDIAHQLAQRSLNSFAWSKKLLNDSFETSLESQMEHEREAIATCAEHPDGREGLHAFQEKRKPKFDG